MGKKRLPLGEIYLGNKRFQLGGGGGGGGESAASKKLKPGEGESAAAAAAAAKFLSVVPDDLLLQILLRLPDSRSVIQCGSVCKRWYSLLSPFSTYLIQRFNHNHNHHRRKRRQTLPYTLLIRGHYMSGIETPPYTKEFSWPAQDYFSKKSKLLHPPSIATTGYLDFLGFPHPFIASSFHDLLLVLPSSYHFYVCNPLTRQSVPLPEAPRCGKKDKIFRCGFVCESNCNCNKQKGFCCNCSGIKYKVVLLTADGEFKPVCHAAIFSSESGQWSVSTFLFPVCLYVWHVASVAVDGTLYFPYGDEHFRGLVAFDVSDLDPERRCRLISLPKDFGGGWQAMDLRARLGMVRGRLRLSQFFWSKRADSFVLKVWQFNTTNSSWDSVHRVSLKRTHQSFSLYLIALHPEDGDAFFFRRENRNKSDICRYKISSNSYQRVCDDPIRADYPRTDSLCVITLVHPWWPTKIPALLPS